MFIEHNRKTIRLKNYNYSQNGLYFITICTYNKNEYFGGIINEKMILNNIGIITKNILFKIIKCFNFKLQHLCFMPNHIHMIIYINNPRRGSTIYENPNKNSCAHDKNRATPTTAVKTQYNSKQNTTTAVKTKHDLNLNTTKQNISTFGHVTPKSISTFIQSFKSNSTKQINKIQPNYFKWQRNYYEHIIRDENAYYKITNYIINNPKIWHRDRNNT